MKTVSIHYLVLMIPDVMGLETFSVYVMVHQTLNVSFYYIGLFNV